MTSVVDISPHRPPATPAFRRIRAASRGLEWLFAALFVAFIALAILSLWVVFFYRGTMIALGPRGGIITTDTLPPGFVPFYTWRLDQRLAYAVVAIVRTAPAIGLFWCLRSLFRRYARGEVFSGRNARLIVIMGAWLAADAAAPLACHLALSATGYEIDHLLAPMGSVQELVLGAVVVVIALVMQAGREIEEDREGFI